MASEHPKRERESSDTNDVTTSDNVLIEKELGIKRKKTLHGWLKYKLQNVSNLKHSPPSDLECLKTHPIFYICVVLFPRDACLWRLLALQEDMDYGKK